MSQKKTGNEKLLVKELRAGNKKTFAKLFDCYKDDVFAYSISMLKVQVLAEEIVQDVFLKIWQNRERLNSDLSFKSYVFTITRNLILNLISKTATNRKLKEALFYGSQKAYSPIEDKITEADYNAIKNKAIEELPPRRKIIFEMSRNKGMSYEEIGNELNISLSTIKGQMNKALSSIRDYLRTHGDVALSIAIVLLQKFEIGRNFKKYYSRVVLTLTSSVKYIQQVHHAIR